MKRVLAVLGILAAGVLGGWYFGVPTAGKPESLRLAVSPQIMSALVYVAADKGFFRDAGLEVTLDTYPFGKDALAQVIQGNADVATVAEVPVMRTLLKGNAASVFAVIQSTDKDVAIVARKDAGIQKPADLAGKRVGVVMGTNHEYYLDLILGVNQVDPASVTFVPVTMDDGADAFISGRVDALSSWITARLKINAAMPGGVVNFSSDGLYTELWTLTTRPDFLAARPEALRRLLRALIKAEQFAANNRQEALAIAARHIKLEPDMAAAIWDDIGLRVSLDQALLIHLEGEARRELQKMPGGAMPNFLDHISAEALKAVDPTRVTITTR